MIAAEDRHHLALDEVLEEHVATGGAERAPHADLVGAREELAEQQADQVDGGNRQEQQADHQQREGLLRRDVEVLHQRPDARDAVVHRPPEACRAFFCSAM